MRVRILSDADKSYFFSLKRKRDWNSRRNKAKAIPVDLDLDLDLIWMGDEIKKKTFPGLVTIVNSLSLR